MTLSGLGVGGQNMLWAVFCIQGTAAIFYYASGFRVPSEKREHFLVTTMIVATASLAYLAMASGLGHTYVDFGTGDKVVTRPIFYARYIDWSITTPLLLVDVLLMAKVPLAVGAWAVFADLAMIITGVIGALVGDNFRWVWFAFGCFAMFAVFAALFLDGSKYVERRDSNLLNFYNTTVAGLVILWTAYPIVWALGEGLNYISSDVECYLYGLLDIAAKVGWGGYILYNNDMLYTSYTKGLSDAEAPLVQA